MYLDTFKDQSFVFQTHTSLFSPEVANKEPSLLKLILR